MLRKKTLFKRYSQLRIKPGQTLNQTYGLIQGLLEVFSFGQGFVSLVKIEDFKSIADSNLKQTLNKNFEKQHKR